MTYNMAGKWYINTDIVKTINKYLLNINWNDRYNIICKYIGIYTVICIQRL